MKELVSAMVVSKIRHSVLIVVLIPYTSCKVSLCIEKDFLNFQKPVQIFLLNFCSLRPPGLFFDPDSIYCK